jgi:hypothetical protein
MNHLIKLTSTFLIGLAIAFAHSPTNAQENDRVTVSVLMRDGQTIEGTTENIKIRFASKESGPVTLSELLSFHSAAPASETEAETIDESLGLLGDTVKPESEIAAAKLTDIGLPVLTPLLKGYADTNAKEPDYKYRLFGRIMPGHADMQDRSLGLVRLTNGKTLRANPDDFQLTIRGENGNDLAVKPDNIRRIAVLQDKITRSFELHALHHCTYVGFMDTGIITTLNSEMQANAEGYVRLSFDEDGWAADPHGIVTPLPGKRKLQEGFRWGSVLARVGPDGERWFVGKHITKENLGSGRLYFVINDNEHWQNNIGSFRVELTVENAFDVGEPY